jgi:hypothetical protein
VRSEQQIQDQAQHGSQQEQKGGFLEKKGHFMKNWKRRYVVWTPADNKLRYYSESKRHRTEKGLFFFYA